ncbi:MAG: hypothetical protein RJB60_1025, partial [Pseudomonadota bacterium]
MTVHPSQLHSLDDVATVIDTDMPPLDVQDNSLGDILRRTKGLTTEQVR